MLIIVAHLERENKVSANVADVKNLSNSIMQIKRFVMYLIEPWLNVRLIDTVLGFSLAVALYVLLLIASFFS